MITDFEMTQEEILGHIFTSGRQAARIAVALKEAKLIRNYRLANIFGSNQARLVLYTENDKGYYTKHW